jgi:hypothetical protein
MENYTEEQAKQVLKDFYDHIDGCFNDGKIRSFLDEKFEKITYSIGDRLKKETKEYIISKWDESSVVLINLNSGNRWGDPVRVGSIHEINKEEYDRLITYSKDFEKIEKP